MAPVKSRPPLDRHKSQRQKISKYKMSNHEMKIRYKMTSLLACKNVYIFLPNIQTRPLRSVRFGSVRFGSEVPCSANFRSVRRFGYSTS